MKIGVKKYVMDESLSWEERYKQLELHHMEETSFLINELDKRLAKLEKWHEHFARDISRAIGATRKYGGSK